jgi:hypothetical protein
MRALSKTLSEVLKAHCANPAPRQIENPLSEECFIDG